ncbi:MAG: signal peptidase I [Anaerosomatales bacterium]|nr:signal peptidase I [Anaerosomatales bacterium]
MAHTDHNEDHEPTREHAPGSSPFGDGPIADRGAPTGPSGLRAVGELVAMLVLAVLLATAVKTFIVQPFAIPSASMNPTLEVGDRIVADRFTYRFTEPRPGDVVVFEAPTGDGTDYIKRVIAIAGQSVDVREGAVWIDGTALAEPYALGVTQPGPLALPLTVPPEHVWLMGDNREDSRDSRWFGPQPVENIVGRAFFIYWPPSGVGGVR